MEFVVHGKRMHARSVSAAGWKQTVEWLREHVDPNAYGVPGSRKHRYVMPLDRAMRRQVAKLAQPYPSANVVVSDVRARAQGEPVPDHGTGAGSIPAARSQGVTS